MKKLNFWLFASLFVAAFTLTACGSDDDDNPGGSDNPGNPTSIVGKWSGFVPAWGEGLLSRYDHYLTYEFTADKKVTIKTVWYYATTDASEAQYAQEVTSEDYNYPAGTYIIEGAIFRFSGTYTDNNGKLVVSMNKTEWYDRDKGAYQAEDYGMPLEWYSKSDDNFDYSTQIDPTAVTISYKISGNKLIIEDNKRILTFHNHGMLTAEMTWQGK